MPRQTLLDFLADHCATAGHQPAALFKRDGAYQSMTWSEIEVGVNRRASALIGVGVEAGERVVILANTRLEWVLWDLAILSAGAVTVPIYHSCLAADCQYIIEHAGARHVICEDPVQVAKVRQEKSRLPAVTLVVQLDGEVAEGSAWLTTESALLARHATDEAQVALRRRALTSDSAMSIIYTSGTTGRPKGAVISHRNVVSTAEAIATSDLVRADDVQLLFLPLAHVFARVLMVAWLATRHQLAFAESMATLRQNLIEVRPTVLAGVPRVFEKFFAAVQARGAAQGPVKAALFARALALSEAAGEARAAARRPSLRAAVEFRALSHLVFGKIGRELGRTLGGRMRRLISGGAPLSPAIAWFFHHAGLPLLEGFGLTETSAASCVNPPARNKIGTVGPPLPHTEVRLGEDGELFIRGGGVSAGYWQNPEATALAFQDGWFATGDVARIDEDGYVQIVDRKKDLIVTAGGKNVAPQNIENLLKTHPLISQAVVHGDRRPYLTALLTLDADALGALAKARGLGDASLAELACHPQVAKEVAQAMAAFNVQLPRWETIKKYRVLEHDFTVDTGELTPSLKVKRRQVTERYRAILDGFYADDGGHSD